MPNILSQTTLQTELCYNYLLTVSNKTMTGFWDGSGISWTICKQSAPRSRQITTPTPHHSMITGRMLFLAPNQQHQSTEGKGIYNSIKKQRQFYHRPRSPVIIATDQKPQATWQCIILTFVIFVVFEFLPSCCKMYRCIMKKSILQEKNQTQTARRMAVNRCTIHNTKR